MEEIIKKAIEGGYKFYIDIANEHVIEVQCDNFNCFRWYYTDIEHTKKDTQKTSLFQIVCDPLFWQALGKACEWEENETRTSGFGDNIETYEHIGEWLIYAQNFHEINLTEGWEKAVEWLGELINNK